MRRAAIVVLWLIAALSAVSMPAARASNYWPDSGGGGLIESLGTACPINEIPKSDGAGGINCAVDATGGGGANSFETQNVAAGTDPVAEIATDTLNWTVGTGITLTGTAGTDTIDVTLAAPLVDLSDGTLTATAIGTGLTDAQVSDTLTASLFVGSGNLTTAVDLDTAEVAGTLAAGNGGTGITSLGAGVATWLGTPTSTNLRTAVATTSTGTAALVFATNPTFTTSYSMGAAGVNFADDGDGALTILGIGDGTADNDEALTFNFEDVANEVTITSTTGVSTINFPNNSISTADLATELRSMYWGASSWSVDGTNCSAPAEVTINSGPKLYTVICNTATDGVAYGSVVMPDGWVDASTVTFQLSYIQTAADTGVMNGDIDAQCRGNGEVPSSTWGTSQAIDDPAVVGSNANDQTTSPAVTPAGSCLAGDVLYWRLTNDNTATTSAQATLHYVGLKMEYTSNVGD